MKAKLVSLLTSRKFWALVSGLVTVWGAVAAHAQGATVAHSVDLTVGLLVAYKLGTAIESARPDAGPALPAASSAPTVAP